VPRPRSQLVCPVCGETGSLARRRRYSSRLGRIVEFYYFIHARKDAETGEWVRKWHYVGTDHRLVAEESNKPVKAWAPPS